MASADAPKTREEALRTLWTKLKMKAAAEEADFCNDRLTEESTIDDDALTEFIKGVAQTWFPDRFDHIMGYQKFQPISRLLDLMGFPNS